MTLPIKHFGERVHSDGIEGVVTDYLEFGGDSDKEPKVHVTWNGNRASGWYPYAALAAAKPVCLDTQIVVVAADANYPDTQRRGEERLTRLLNDGYELRGDPVVRITAGGWKAFYTLTLKA